MAQCTITDSAKLLVLVFTVGISTVLHFQQVRGLQQGHLPKSFALSAIHSIPTCQYAHQLCNNFLLAKRAKLVGYTCLRVSTTSSPSSSESVKYDSANVNFSTADSYCYDCTSQVAALPKNLYATLGVPRTADHAQIKAAYRKLAKLYHPDAAHGTPEEEQRAMELFKEVNHAYHVLADNEKRHDYDPFWQGYVYPTSSGNGQKYIPTNMFNGMVNDVATPRESFLHRPPSAAQFFNRSTTQHAKANHQEPGYSRYHAENNNDAARDATPKKPPIPIPGPGTRAQVAHSVPISPDSPISFKANSKAELYDPNKHGRTGSAVEKDDSRDPSTTREYSDVNTDTPHTLLKTDLEAGSPRAAADAIEASTRELFAKAAAAHLAKEASANASSTKTKKANDAVVTDSAAAVAKALGLQMNSEAVSNVAGNLDHKDEEKGRSKIEIEQRKIMNNSSNEEEKDDEDLLDILESVVLSKPVEEAEFGTEENPKYAGEIESSKSMSDTVQDELHQSQNDGEETSLHHRMTAKRLKARLSQRQELRKKRGTSAGRQKNHKSARGSNIQSRLKKSKRIEHGIQHSKQDEHRSDEQTVVDENNAYVPQFVEQDVVEKMNLNDKKTGRPKKLKLYKVIWGEYEIPPGQSTSRQSREGKERPPLPGFADADGIDTANTRQQLTSSTQPDDMASFLASTNNSGTDRQRASGVDVGTRKEPVVSATSRSQNDAEESATTAPMKRNFGPVTRPGATPQLFIPQQTSAQHIMYNDNHQYHQNGARSPPLITLNSGPGVRDAPAPETRSGAHGGANGFMFAAAAAAKRKQEAMNAEAIARAQEEEIKAQEQAAQQAWVDEQYRLADEARQKAAAKVKAEFQARAEAKARAEAEARRQSELRAIAAAQAEAKAQKLAEEQVAAAARAEASARAEAEARAKAAALATKKARVAAEIEKAKADAKLWADAEARTEAQRIAQAKANVEAKKKAEEQELLRQQLATRVKNEQFNSTNGKQQLSTNNAPAASSTELNSRILQPALPKEIPVKSGVSSPTVSYPNYISVGSDRVIPQTSGSSATPIPIPRNYRKTKQTEEAVLKPVPDFLAPVVPPSVAKETSKAPSGSIQTPSQSTLSKSKMPQSDMDVRRKPVSFPPRSDRKGSFRTKHQAQSEEQSQNHSMHAPSPRKISLLVQPSVPGINGVRTARRRMLQRTNKTQQQQAKMHANRGAGRSDASKKGGIERAKKSCKTVLGVAEDSYASLKAQARSEDAISDANKAVEQKQSMADREEGMEGGQSKAAQDSLMEEIAPHMKERPRTKSNCNDYIIPDSFVSGPVMENNFRGFVY